MKEVQKSLLITFTYSKSVLFFIIQFHNMREANSVMLFVVIAFNVNIQFIVIYTRAAPVVTATTYISNFKIGRIEHHNLRC